MFNDILDKAKELGIMISKSEIRKDLTLAGDKINNDPEASKLIKDYNNMRKESIDALIAKNASPDEVDSVDQEIQKELDRISENPLIKDYMAVNKAYNSLIEDVNDILGYYINGGNENITAGCSGNCSSCSGC